MNIKKGKQFRMPAEYERHRGTLMIWPVRAGSWGVDATKAQEAFCRIAELLLETEEVFFLVNEEDRADAERKLPKGVQILEIETDDAWARDVGPTFVKDEEGSVYGIDWCFNAWGGEVDGLYANWKKDDAAAKRFCEALKYPVLDAHPFILEGGSIHTDGEGTLMTTEACLLSKGRNAGLSREEIREKLCQYLGGEKLLWLPRGIYNDETNEHVDNVCAFIRPGEVVLAWTEDKSDPQYALSDACYQYLRRERDAKGRELKIYKLPIPKKPILISEEDLEGYHFEEGEDRRELGERLAASYVNFYIGNSVVVLPAFGDENDSIAVESLKACFPDRRVLSVPARDILLGGGNIHCITQQIPL